MEQVYFKKNCDFDEDRTTLGQKQQDLIMLIDNYPYFIDTDYSLILCKFAH